MFIAVLTTAPCAISIQSIHSLTSIMLVLTYSMVQSPSWAANWFAASQEIPRISRNPKVHYRTHNRPPPVSILGQPNPVHISTSHLLEIHMHVLQGHYVNRQLSTVTSCRLYYRINTVHSAVQPTNEAEWRLEEIKTVAGQNKPPPPFKPTASSSKKIQAMYI